MVNSTPRAAMPSSSRANCAPKGPAACSMLTTQTCATPAAAAAAACARVRSARSWVGGTEIKAAATPSSDVTSDEQTLSTPSRSGSSAGDREAARTVPMRSDAAAWRTAAAPMAPLALTTATVCMDTNATSRAPQTSGRPIVIDGHDTVALRMRRIRQCAEPVTCDVDTERGQPRPAAMPSSGGRSEASKVQPFPPDGEIQLIFDQRRGLGGAKGVSSRRPDQPRRGRPGGGAASTSPWRCRCGSRRRTRSSSASI
eukprot:2859406-Prymnesium_polylepis.2